MARRGEVTPTDRQVRLARAAIEAAWVEHLAEVGRYAIAKRVSVVVTPPTGNAIYEGAKRIAELEASVSDWDGEDTAAANRDGVVNAAKVKDEHHAP